MSVPNSRPRIWRSAFWFPVVVAVLVGGCGGDSDSPGQGGPPARAAQSSGTGSGFRPDLPPVPVAVETVSRGSIASYYAATASLEPEKQAQILARVSGVVLELHGEEGDAVREGESLLRIQDDEYRYRLAQAEAEKVKQQARYERSQKMFEQNLISSEGFEAVKTDLQAAEAAADLAALELSYTEVRAPFAGKVIRRYVDPGQTVSSGTQLFDLADMKPLLARVHVPAKEFRNIRPDQPVVLSVDATSERLGGTITLVSPVVDPASGTIKVTVEVPEYPSTVRPGDFAEVRIVTARHDQTLLVPKGAVLTDKGERVVFLAAPDSTAERRVVETGFEDDLRVEILAGLADGDLVVIQGQRSLKHGQPLKILEPMRFEDEVRPHSPEASASSGAGGPGGAPPVPAVAAATAGDSSAKPASSRPAGRSGGGRGSRRGR